MNRFKKQIGRSGIVIDGFNIKPDYMDESGNVIRKRKKPKPFHNLSEGSIVNIIGIRNEEYVVHCNGRRQHIKRKYLKLI